MICQATPSKTAYGVRPTQGRRLDQEQKFHLTTKVIDALAPVPKYAAVVIGIWIAGHYIVEAISLLAGQRTDVSLAVKILMNLQADRWMAYLVADGAGAYGWNERRLRRKDIERLTRHTEELEKRIDPNRTSSRLLPDGRTRWEDR
jgi:hypothetical protein